MATRKPAARKAPAKSAPRAKPGPKPKAASPAHVDVANGTAAPAASTPPAFPHAAPTHGGSFQFSNGENVTIMASNEEGIVRGRCEWLTGNISYFVAYTSARGEFKEAWIDQDLLTGEL